MKVRELNMGLDMYLTGRTFNWTDWKNRENNPKIDGFEVEGVILKLGYWRKHPDLHGFIVKNFAEGVDECQEIDLSQNQIKEIIKAVEEKRLPHTEGFFFGQSSGKDDKQTIEILKGALRWLGTEDKKMSKSVIYRGSW